MNNNNKYSWVSTGELLSLLNPFKNLGLKKKKKKVKPEKVKKEKVKKEKVKPEKIKKVKVKKEKIKKEKIKKVKVKKDKVKKIRNKKSIVSHVDEAIIISNYYKNKIITPYDNLFSNLTKEQGKQYFLDNKVTNYSYNKNECSGTVNDKFNCKITFNEQNIEKVKCNCSSIDNEYCKHIYSLLLEYCDDQLIIKYENDILARTSNSNYNDLLLICKKMNNTIKNSISYYETVENKSNQLEDIYNQIISYKSILENYQKTKIVDLKEEIIDNAKNDNDELEKLKDDLVYIINKIEDEETI